MEPCIMYAQVVMCILLSFAKLIVTHYSIHVKSYLTYTFFDELLIFCMKNTTIKKLNKSNINICFTKHKQNQ